MDYMKHFIIPQYDNPLTHPYTIQNISAVVADMTDTAIYQAIIRSAKESGITDLYMMDKQFVFDALKEKLEREKPKPLTIEELRQMDGEPVYVKGLGWRVIYGTQVFMGKFYIYTSKGSRIEVNENLEFYRYKPKEVNHGEK